MVRDSRLRACLFWLKSYNAHVRVMQKDACLTLVQIGRVFPLEQAREAYTLMQEGKNYGKIVLKIS